MLAMKERAEGLEKIAATGNTPQLPPGTAIRMAIGAEIAPAHPAAIGTVWVWAEVRRGIHLAAAPSRGHDARGRACGGLWARVGAMRTGVAVRLGGEPCKGFGRTLTRAPWGWGLRCRRAHGGVAGPCPLKHEAQPYQGNQGQLVEKESGDHGKTPSDRWRNEGIVPGFQTVGISRRLEIHDHIAPIDD